MGIEKVIDGNLTITGGITYVSNDYAHLSHSSAQNVNNTTWTQLDFDTEMSDLGGMHAVGANGSRITCVNAGFYLIGCAITWESNNTGFRKVRFLENGVATGIIELRAAINETNSIVVGVRDLSVTGYVEVDVYQTSGAALDVDSCRFWAIRILGN